MAERAERTAEEREAARRERERRRARAGGAALTPEPARATSAPADPTPAPPATLDGDGDYGAGTDPAADGDPAADEHEPASGTRRVGWRERRATAAGRARPGARKPSRPRPPREPLDHRRRTVVRALAVLALVLAAGVIWFCVELFQPFHGSGHGSLTVTIPPHSSTSRVGGLLEGEGVIASSFFFQLRATLAGDRGKLLAGAYRLRRDMSYGQVLHVLTTPPPAAKVTDVTIVPGQTRLQTDALLRSQGVAGSYLAASRPPSPLRPATYGAPRRTRSLEGFLFPDTYQLREPIAVTALVDDQLSQFRREFATVKLGYARSKGLTAYEVLIVASIVEKEAATAHDRPLVASVIYNRLRDQIPLGMDSTTRYEFNDYTAPLTQAQLSSPSPYNTRLHAGLPPTPISNPGLAAIRAAASPARTGYLYFVVKPCGNGESVFSSSYAKFLADSARYASARARRGGRSPASC